MKWLYIIIILLFTLNSCDNYMCGSLPIKWKLQLEKAKGFNEGFYVENIPCEYFYINLNLSTNEIDSSKIRALHKLLYNPKTKVGWKVILVHDNNGNYLFSHHFSGKISVQEGD